MDSDGTFAYEGGGYSFSVGDNINEFGKFDPVANTWTPLAPVPDLNNGEASAVYAPNVNKLFVFGGEEVTFATVVNTTRIYDIATDTWTQRANLPSGENVPGSAVIGGKLWIFGGGEPFANGPAAAPTSAKKGLGAWLKRLLRPDTTNILQVYDPLTDSWSGGPSLNQVRSFPAGTDVGNTAVADGGYTGVATTTSVEINVTSGGVCPSPSPTATATATATGTPLVTATPTATATPLVTATPTATP